MFAALNSFLTRAVSGYFLNKSLRFRSSASAYLNRTFGTPTSGTTWTWSGWVKRGALGSLSEIFTGNSAVNITALEFQSSDTLYFQLGNGTTAYSIGTTAVFRDPAAWYHISVVADTTQASGTITGISTDRIKMYINGVQVTSFIGGSPTPPPQNYVGDWNLNGAAGNIGRWTSGASRYFDGEMAEVNFVDGQALLPTAFGAYSTYNQWLPKKYAGTYGTNGFYLPFSATSATSYAGSFNGSTQYLAYPNNAAFSFGSSNFTIEAWIKVTSTSNYNIYVNSDTSNNLGVTLYAGGGTIHAFVTASPGGNIVYDLQGPASSVVTGVWTHIAFVRSGTTFTAYVNGVAGTPSTNSNAMPPSQARCYIGTSYNAAAGFFSGDISNYRVVNGTAVYTANFVPPTAALTAITNTSLLTLQNATIVDNSTNAFAITNTGTVVTSVQSPFLNPTVLTADSSGNANNWTPNNISLTAGSTYDSLTDVPTLTSTTVANYAVLNPLDSGSSTLSINGNLTYSNAAASHLGIRGSIAIPASGAFYMECVTGSTTNNTSAVAFGLGASTVSLTATLSAQANLYQLWAALGGYIYNGATVISSSLGAFSAGDVMQIAVDVTNTKMWLGKNNVWYNNSGGTTGNPSTGANPTFTTSMVGLFPTTGAYANSVNANFGQQPFAYTAPTGFLPLNTFNI